MRSEVAIVDRPPTGPGYAGCLAQHFDGVLVRLGVTRPWLDSAIPCVRSAIGWSSVAPTAATLLPALLDLGVPLTGMQVRSPNLEDLFPEPDRCTACGAGMEGGSVDMRGLRAAVRLTDMQSREWTMKGSLKRIRGALLCRTLEVRTRSRGPGVEPAFSRSCWSSASPHLRPRPNRWCRSGWWENYPQPYARCAPLPLLGIIPYDGGVEGQLRSVTISWTCCSHPPGALLDKPGCPSGGHGQYLLRQAVQGPCKESPERARHPATATGCCPG